MGDDERQRVGMFRTDMNEMDGQPIDRGDELRQGIEFRLALAPVVLCRPIACEFLNRRELHTLRLICNSLPSAPSGGGDACTHEIEFGIGELDREWLDRGGARRLG